MVELNSSECNKNPAKRLYCVLYQSAESHQNKLEAFGAIAHQSLKSTAMIMNMNQSLQCLSDFPSYLLRHIRFISVVDFRLDYYGTYTYSIHKKRNAHTKSDFIHKQVRKELRGNSHEALFSGCIVTTWKNESWSMKSMKTIIFIIAIMHEAFIMPSSRGVTISFSHSFISFIHSLNIGCSMQANGRNLHRHVNVCGSASASLGFIQCSLNNITAVC